MLYSNKSNKCDVSMSSYNTITNNDNNSKSFVTWHLKSVASYLPLTSTEADHEQHCGITYIHKNSEMHIIYNI